MKKDIHPTYYTNAKVICACGNKFTVGSTLKEIRTEICSECHPFYTGKENIIDTAGRVDRFRARIRKTSELKKKGSKAKAVKQNTSSEEGKMGNKAKLEKIRHSLSEK